MTGAGRARGRWPGAAVALAIVFALVVAACSPESPQATATSTEPPAPTPAVTLYQLNTSVWYAGLVLTFASATAIFDPSGGTLTVLLRMDNPGSDDLTFEGPMRITAGAEGFDPVHGTTFPTVTAGGTTEVLVTFDIPGRPSVDDAVIRVGRSDANQAILPFGTGLPKLTTLEPVPITLKGSANAADLRVTLKSGELRWDLPDWADELPVGRAALTLTYDATYRGTFSGGLAFTGDNVRLTLPDGSIVGPRPDGRSQSVTLLFPNKPQLGLSTRFEVPSGMPGKYVLVIRNGSTRASLPFTVPG
jgi:hypothetical protein